MSTTLITMLRKGIFEADPIQAGFQVDFEERNADPSKYTISQPIHPAAEQEMDEQNDGGVDTGGMNSPYEGSQIPGAMNAPMQAAPTDAELANIEPGGGPGGMGEMPMMNNESEEYLDLLIDDLLTEEELSERGPFGYGGFGGYGGVPYPQAYSPYSYGQNPGGRGPGYNPYQGLRGTRNNGVAMTRQQAQQNSQPQPQTVNGGTYRPGQYPINYGGRQFGGTPNYNNFMRNVVAPRNYQGFSGPQAPPPDVQARGPAAIKQWQQQMQAVGQQTHGAPTGGPAGGPHQHRPAHPGTATPNPDEVGDSNIPHGANHPTTATPARPAGDPYDPVGRPTEGNPNRTNTGAAPPGDGQMHWSWGTGFYRGGGVRDPDHHVPDHVPGTEPAAPPHPAAAQYMTPQQMYGSGSSPATNAAPGANAAAAAVAPSEPGGFGAWLMKGTVHDPEVQRQMAAQQNPTPTPPPAQGRAVPPGQPQPARPTVTSGPAQPSPVAAPLAPGSTNMRVGAGATPVPPPPAQPAPMAAKSVVSNVTPTPTTESKQWNMTWDDFVILSESDKGPRKY